MADRFDLSGKRALVTGGGRGLGSALALGLARAGADVVVASRGYESCDATASAIRALGRRAKAMTVDMAEWLQVDSLATHAFDFLGGIDVLVNNAAQTEGLMPLEKVTRDYFSSVFAINVGGPLRLATKTVELVDGKSDLSIINLSSMGARRPFAGSAVYAASKAALETATQVMAMEWVNRRVRVNALAPGPIRTDMLATVEIQRPGTIAAVSDLVPMKRVADPDELVGALLYLASGASSYATGTVLSVNGGW